MPYVSLCYCDPLLIPNVSYSKRTTPGNQAAAAPQRSRSDSQLEAWLRQEEAHEELAVGEKVSRSKIDLERFLNGVEKKLDGLDKWWKK